MGSHRAPLTAEDEEAFLNEALACSLTSSSRDASHNRRDSTGELEQLQLALALSASEAEATGRPANLPPLRASGNEQQRGICAAASAPPITSAGCSSNGTGADTPLRSHDRQGNSVHASREAWYESLTELSLPSTPAAPPTRRRGLDPRSDEELARRLQEKYDREQDSCVSDSELARALQEQLQQEASGKLQPDADTEPVAEPAEPRRLATRPPTSEDGKPGVRENFFNRLRGSYRASSGTWEGQCAGCGRAVDFGEAVVAGGRRWHSGCFVCVACDKRIKSKYVTHEGCCLHLSCFENIRYPKCNVCNQIIKPGASARVEYLKEPFWKETYCKRHRDDGTPRCTSCLRLQPQSEDWAVLEDGRSLCFMCLDTTVLDTQAAQPLYREVLKFYEGLGMKLPEQPPLMLVESAVLNEKEEGQGGRQSGPIFHTRGLTLIKHYQVIRTVRSPQRGKEGKRWGVVPEVVPVVSKRASIQGILVIYGLPWLLTGSILAHELMHAWLRLTGVNSLPQQVEEGLCQLMAYLWLEAQETRSGDAQSQRLASYFGYQIRSDQSEVYGDGFRQAHDGFQLLGLQQLLAVVRERKAFPR